MQGATRDAARGAMIVAIEVTDAHWSGHDADRRIGRLRCASGPCIAGCGASERMWCGAARCATGWPAPFWQRACSGWNVLGVSAPGTERTEGWSRRGRLCILRSLMMLRRSRDGGRRTAASASPICALWRGIVRHSRILVPLAWAVSEENLDEIKCQHLAGGLGRFASRAVGIDP